MQMLVAVFFWRRAIPILMPVVKNKLLALLLSEDFLFLSFARLQIHASNGIVE